MRKKIACTLSIIVPVYNVEADCLRRCIESVIALESFAIEIILINDGSTDASGSVCDEYASKDARIHVIHKDNGGVGSARNSGVLVANGKYIMFLDGDDWIGPGSVQPLIERADHENLDILIFTAIREFGNSSEIFTYDLLEDKTYTNEDRLQLMKKSLDFNANISSSWGKLLRKSFLETKGILHNEALRQGAEDLEFCFRLFDGGGRVSFSQHPLYHYWYNSESTTQKHDEKHHALRYRCFCTIREYIAEKGYEDELLGAFRIRLLFIVMTVAISGYFSTTNKEPFCIQKEKYLAYISQDIFEDALQNADTKCLSFVRRVAVFFIRHRMFFCVKVMASMRRLQQKSR